MQPLDIAGQRFGRLVALKYSHSGIGGRRWECACDCGGFTVVSVNALRRSNTTSCGCRKVEVRAALNVTEKRTHGHCPKSGSSREYRSWRAMKGRCLNPNDPAYKRYGGRGISIDPLWLSFETFLADMGARPEGTTLDRIDNDKGYSPDNCRWATNAQQNRNRRMPWTKGCAASANRSNPTEEEGK